MTTTHGSTLGRVEDAIVERIRRVAGKHLRTVESLPAEMDEDTFKRMLVALPGAFVYAALGGTTRIGGPSMAIDSQWIVYLATGHASGHAARRQGDALQVGAFELIEVLGPALHGMTVPEVGTLQFVRAEPNFSGMVDKRGAAIYSLTFQMPLGFPTAEPDVLLSRFETFSASYDVPAFANAADHAAWLAGARGTQAPDAQDRVGLAQD